MSSASMADRTTRRRVSARLWVLLAAGVAVVAIGLWFLRTPALEDGAFQSFPGGTAGDGVVTYEQADGSEIFYVLTMRSRSSVPITLIGATVDGGALENAEVDLGRKGATIDQAGEMSDGDELRFAVRGTLKQCSEQTRTEPVPSVTVTYRQLGITRTATITAQGRGQIRTC